MKIKVIKDYFWLQTTYESDMRLLSQNNEISRNNEITMPSNYSGTWIEEDVTLEKLQEYVNNNYAIKINC